MHLLQTSRPTRPTAGTPVNPGHSLSLALRGYWLASEGGTLLLDSVSGPPATFSSSAVNPADTAPYGLGASFTDATSAWSAPQIQGLYAPAQLPVSMMCIASFSSLVVNHGLVETCSFNGGSSISGCFLCLTNPVTLSCGFGDATVGSNQAQFQKASAPITTGTEYVISCSIRASADMSIYVNGVDVGATSAVGTAQPMAQATTPPKIGSMDAVENFVSSHSGDVIIASAIWARDLSAADHQQLAADPFAMFQSTSARVNLSQILATIPRPLGATGAVISGALGIGPAGKLPGKSRRPPKPGPEPPPVPHTPGKLVEGEKPKQQ